MGKREKQAAGCMEKLYTFLQTGYNKTVALGIDYGEKAGDCMSDDLAVIRDALNDFRKVQQRMLLAREENAVRTYADLKDDYVSIKELLRVSGVNLTEIDTIKE